MNLAENIPYISREKINKNCIDYRFKILYSIGIISVIASHLSGKGSIELNIQGWFNYNTYHMPLFMFSAGYFYKSKNMNNTCDYIYKKFKRLIFPIYLYNCFYGIYIQFLGKFGFNTKIRPFTFSILFIEPLEGSGFRNIKPSWFSSTLFFVESYNILKRKIISFLLNELNESIYLIFDSIISIKSIILSNKGYNKYHIYMVILRIIHLNIYYELGIFYKKHIERILKNIRNDIYCLHIFTFKLCFHLYYSKAPFFYYGMSQYYNYSPFTVIIISILGIAFWLRISEILEPLIGKNFYVNIIADNTFSIMINHLFSIDILKFLFSFISKKTKYFKNFNFKRFYSLDSHYIFLPNNVLQTGILYFLSCLALPIIIQKIINKIKYKIFSFIL